MNETKPTHLDLFSGIGGFSLAAERCGFRTIGFSEIDPYASAVLKKHWPDVPNYGDIRNIPCEELRGTIALLTGGFPCQPFSVAGSKRGDRDERHLWPLLAEIIGKVRPRFCLLENVSGLLSISNGRVFGAILGDLASLGYDALWNCVPASAVGANHQRDRVWIVAYNAEGFNGKPVTASMQGQVQQSGKRSIAPDVADTRRESSPTLEQVIGGQLNPQFVEWLMGYPIDHTALDASEIVSSRKSRRSSSKKLES